MKSALLGAVILTACVFSSTAAESPSGSAPKGTICYSNNLVVAGEATVVINCKGLGKFSSISDIYDRGYRVVNSGFLPDPRSGMPPLTSTMYLIIEERR